MAAARMDVKEEAVTPQPDRRRPPQPDHCVSSSPSQSQVQVQDPDSMLSIADFVGPITHAGGSMQFILEAAAASSEDALGARLRAFFEPKSDLSYATKVRTEILTLEL